MGEVIVSREVEEEFLEDRNLGNLSPILEALDEEFIEDYRLAMEEMLHVFENRFLSLLEIQDGTMMFLGYNKGSLLLIAQRKKD